MRKEYLLVALFSFLMLYGCTNTTRLKDTDDYKSMIADKFKAKEFTNFIIGSPALGGNSNIYCTFSDNDSNNLFLVSTLTLGKYILINKSSPIDKDKDALEKKYNKLIESFISKIGGEVVVKDIVVYKCESNIGYFNNNQAGFLYLSKISDSNGDPDKLKASGNYSYDVKVLFSVSDETEYYTISGIDFF